MAGARLISAVTPHLPLKGRVRRGRRKNLVSEGGSLRRRWRLRHCVASCCVVMAIGVHSAYWPLQTRVPASFGFPLRSAIVSFSLSHLFPLSFLPLFFLCTQSCPFVCAFGLLLLDIIASCRRTAPREPEGPLVALGAPHK